MFRSVISICIKLCLGCSFLGSTPLFAQDITTGLVGYWSFDEGQGATTNDHSGNDNTGTVSGATWSFDGKLGGCLDFDGIDDYVDFGTSASLDIAGAITISAWVKPGTVLPSTQNILNKGSYWNSTFLGLYYAHPEGGDEDYAYNPSASLVANQWTHLILTYEAPGKWRIYLNGVGSIVSPATPVGAISRPINSWRAGAASLGAASPFQGKIDEIRIYNRSFTEADAEELYKNGHLIAYWKMDENIGTLIADSAGNNDGIAYNTTWVETAERDAGLAFVGVHDSLAIVGNGIARLRANFTVTAWVKRNSSTSNQRIISSSTTNGWALGFQNDFLKFSNYSIKDYLTSISIPLDTWTHIAVTFSTNYEARFYVNGVYRETITGTAPIPYNTDDYRLGKGTTAKGEPFAGQLDEVRVYSRALTATEIIEVYGLVGHWKLDETSGTVALDSSPYANHGTYKNGVTLGVAGKSSLDLGIAASFDGIDDYVLGSTSLMNDRKTYTISGWAKIKSLSDGLGLFGQDDVAELLLYQHKLLFYNPTTNGIISSITWPTDVWHHIAISYGESNAKLYLNGLEVASSSLVGVSSSSSPFNLAGYVWTPDLITPLHGSLDDVRVYNYAFSADDLQKLYSADSSSPPRIISWQEIQ